MCRREGATSEYIEIMHVLLKVHNGMAIDKCVAVIWQHHDMAAARIRLSLMQAGIVLHDSRTNIATRTTVVSESNATSCLFAIPGT